MTRHLVTIAAAAAACLILACSDEDTPTAPDEGPQGHWATTAILCSGYENDRFFRLDLPALPGDAHEALGYLRPDQPGRDVAGEFIDVASIRIYRRLGAVVPRADDILFAAAAKDSTGRWGPDFLDGVDPDSWVDGQTWRPVASELLRDVDGSLVGVDLGQEMPDIDVLGVVYRVTDAGGNTQYIVGDHPELGGQRGLDLEGSSYYRFKLLKPRWRDPFTFQYVLRNIYSLGAGHIDADGFELRIESLAADGNPDQHGTRGLRYLRLFGLDSENTQGEHVPDGIVDMHRAEIFDLNGGLLRFPLDFPFPFRADEDTYRQYAQPDPGQWEWDGTYLKASIDVGVGFYDWTIQPQDYYRTAGFQLVARRWVAGQYDELPGLTPPAWLSLDRSDWHPASLPVWWPMDCPGRAEDIRWYAPRDRVRRRLLEPDLEGPARDETVPALALTVDPLGEPWQWAGLMTSFTRVGLDLAGLDRLEIWINDFAQNPAERRGILHVDLGTLDEDFHWPRHESGQLETGTWQLEDLNRDGIFVVSAEDVGLDALIVPETQEVIQEGQPYSADPGTEANPFPQINNTARNGREDDEDLDGDTRFGRENRYLSWSVDLGRDEADVDVARLHDHAELEGTAWRKYVLLLADGLQVDGSDKYESEFLDRFTGLRIWIENPGDSAPRRSQIARLRFR